ncbi:hypothetical protein [Puia dinghuensis]|uniref:Uncharacterized protein n=1 Tax=Puia dinghuensis TaxID=1792502 RepID=A0A8J2UHV4_9BACT|nr:hypothetical protein [Puia dinghuensis]GGB20109.1 hypothetical protein GCM10011511_49790 [Puia dinghuensis]
MKEVLLVLCGLLIGRQLMAQTFSEWFRQNHTQLKYLAEQIAALRGYGSVLEKGYAVAQTGLGEIDTIDTTDLAMHTEHFASLDRVSPAVTEDGVVGTIASYSKLLMMAADDIAAASGSLPATPANFPVMGREVAGDIKEAVEDYQKQAADLCTDDRLQLNDAERLRRLDTISRELRSLYRKSIFLLGLLEEANV